MILWQRGHVNQTKKYIFFIFNSNLVYQDESTAFYHY